MDILNFISWIKSGRKFTNVNKDTTLIPVGVRDNRRDDKYLTGGISVTDFSNELGIGIEIPKLIARAVNGDVTFSLDFYQSDAWKKLNPRIFLYRVRKKRTIRKNFITTRKPSGFVHPTNTAGVQPGGRWWTGSQKIIEFIYSAPDPLIRNTEFLLPTTLPYKYFNLADLNPYQWVMYCDQNANTARQTTATDFPVPTTAVGADNGNINGFYVKMFQAGKSFMYPTSNRDVRASKMKTIFRFAIVIDNPNATPDAPFLIGPMSENVTLKFNTDNNSALTRLTFTTSYVNKITSTM
jgi:hypothetical protein